MTRYEMADYALKSKAMGVNFIGACCGAVAVHLREMAKVLGKHQEEQIWQPDPDKPMSETGVQLGTATGELSARPESGVHSRRQEAGDKAPALAAGLRGPLLHRQE